MHRRLLDAGLSVSPAYGNKTRESFVGDVNFDANMVIILAALLCALICALGLNSIVRCVLRCGRRFSTGTTEQTTARLVSTGLKKRHLSQIPVKVYGPAANIPATECPICLGEFEKGDKVRMLPKCNHGFHVSCIDTWLLSHSSCPNCRHSLLEKPTNSKSNSNSNRRSEGGEVAGARDPADGSGNMQVPVAVVDEQAS
ncbi:RING-H2 finger protein ATL74-like [Prosopis cineraria]|uniref:RING-H2 finger protein ATL74-like n=1 Tax=Prosopis cineraria TaxID=364024 RepID=UPI00240F20CC|nr:RING-H2 finger protein ATL74-like [Prosopis cineraria]